jgi:membrane-bound lytic murein transglycosylase D
MMRPNATTLCLLLSAAATLAGADRARAEEPSTVVVPTVESGTADAAAVPALHPSAPVAPPRQQLPPESLDSGEPGSKALPSADVPLPQPVRSAAALARQGREATPEEAGDTDQPDAPEIAAEIEQQSAEMEAVRKAEESLKVSERASSPRGVPPVDGLGLESPIRDRVEGALSRPELPPGAGGRVALLPELDHDLAALQAEYDIPVEVNPAVVQYIRFFQSPIMRPHFVKWLGRAHRYEEKYRAILREEGVPEDTFYLAMIESGFGNFAYSRAKASGPWQFIAATGRLMGLHQDFWVDERRDPERAARAAARYLKRLHEQTGDWRLAWAGYNAGVGRIFSAQRKGFDDFWAMAATPGKKVLRAETKGYVPKLMAAAIISKHPEAFGFKADEIDREQWTDYTEVEVPQATLLSVLARAAGVQEREIIDLNPELRRACTPPRAYKLKLPAPAAATFAENWPAMRDRVRTTFEGHIIQRGDTLSRIATRYGVPVDGILEMNSLPRGKKLRVGMELLIPKPVSSGVATARTVEPPHRAADEAPRARPAPEARHRSGRTTLRVRSGDTLWSISQKYGVEMNDLCKWNNIRDPQKHKLVAGTRLVVFSERG